MTEASPARANMGFIGAIVAVATIGGFMFGYDSGVINGTQEGLEKAFNLSALGTGVNVGAILIGCAIGAFLAGRMADVIGRKNVMLLAAIAFILSAIGTGAAGSSDLFVLARFIGGLGVGAASVLSPAYISEVTPAAIRGRLSSVQQIMIIIGLTTAFLANYLLANWAQGSTGEFWLGYPAWRWMFWMQLIPATIFLVCLLFIPESPRYLVSKGREEQAHGVLSRLFGEDVARAKVSEIRASLVEDHRPRLSDLKGPGGAIRPIVWAGIMLAVFQQLVGINIVFYYGAILACLLSIALIDKIGRKPILLVGSAGMVVTLGLMAYAFSTGSLDTEGTLHMDPGIGRVALVSAIAYAALFNFSWGPVMWVMLGEMFPNQIRGSALAVAGLAQWIANFAIVVSFPWLLQNIGLPVTYGFYAASALVSYFLVQRFIHETRGKELEQMEG
jgi:SP family sugar:H+ symporter-like MFS transporter